MKKLNLIMQNTKSDSETIDIHEEDIDVDFFNDFNNNTLRSASCQRIGIRSFNEFEGKAIYLIDHFDYILGLDSQGVPILVPLKKE